MHTRIPRDREGQRPLGGMCGQAGHRDFQSFLKRVGEKEIGGPLVSQKKDGFNDEYDIIKIMNCIIKFIFFKEERKYISKNLSLCVWGGGGGWGAHRSLVNNQNLK